MCYLTKISGKFQGGGEYVGLGQMEDGDPRRMHWTFKVRAKNEQGVGGCMRCIDFDQR
jgi:hypothetical protein